MNKHLQNLSFFQNLEHRTYSTLLLILIAFGSWMIKIGIDMRAKKLQTQVQTEHAATIGYPAGPSEIENEATYWVNTAVVDRWSDQTNFVVVLQKVTVRSSDDYRHSRTNRLFVLPFNLDLHGYYRIYKKGDALGYVEIPPPTRE